MGKSNLVQTDFLAGEISPRMEMQDNLEGRKHGVERMENFFTHLQGTAETSRGTEWVGYVDIGAGRMFGFPVSFAVNFMVVISETRVKVFDSTGEVEDFASPWAIASYGSIQAKMFPDANSMVFASSGAVPQVLAYDDFLDTWAFAAMSITNLPGEWGPNYYPPAVGFFGGRMWIGGIEDDPAKFWGSVPDEYDNFQLGTALPADAIESRLSRQGAIRWIAGGPGLLIGTSNAEHIVDSVSGVIQPGDINSRVQSTNGSFPAQSLEVGNEVMYISPDGRKLRSIGYEWLKDAWRSRDLTHASEHITKDNEFTNLVYAANPDSLITGTTRAGSAITATYETYSQTVGFSRRTTQGDIVSIGVVSSAGSDELWMLVDRGNGSLEVEKETHPDNIKLDSHTIFESVTPITGGTVLQLALKTCQVLVDGAIHPDVIPDAAGLFEIGYPGYEIIIGLQISSIIVTLPVADEIAKVGTTRPMKKRWTELWVRILDSWKPKVNGRRAPARTVSTPMGEVEPARTESVPVSNTGTDLEAKVTIEQDLPLRTEIAGWFGRIIQEET